VTPTPTKTVVVYVPPTKAPTTPRPTAVPPTGNISNTIGIIGITVMTIIGGALLFFL